MNKKLNKCIIYHFRWLTTFTLCIDCWAGPTYRKYIILRSALNVKVTLNIDFRSNLVKNTMKMGRYPRYEYIHDAMTLKLTKNLTSGRHDVKSSDNFENAYPSFFYLVISIKLGLGVINLQSWLEISLKFTRNANLNFKSDHSIF